jgi:hypothetical protein
MFKVRQGSDATDRDGVQNDCDDKVIADYFLYQRKGMKRRTNRFFEMNDSMRIKEMKLFWLTKGV